MSIEEEDTPLELDWDRAPSTMRAGRSGGAAPADAPPPEPEAVPASDLPARPRPLPPAGSRVSAPRMPAPEPRIAPGGAVPLEPFGARLGRALILPFIG